MSRGVTMNDVAAAAGVSLKTVSNVVRDYEHVSDSTRERVERAIADLGYRVNISARNLRSGKTGIVGLAVPELSLPYFAELADSVIRAAEERGLIVLIEQTGADRQRELDVLAGKRRHFTDGLIFSPLALGQDDAAVFDVDFPMVLLGERIFSAPADHVTMANVEAARAATEHLLSLGRRRIAVVGAHERELVGSAALRVRGYREALTAAGVPFDPALLVEGGLWHRAMGASAVNGLLDAGIEFDGVFGLNDALALGALHALHARDIDVPRQVAVIGFDDIEAASYAFPSLTTISPGREQIANTSLDLLVRRMEATTKARSYTRVIADFEVIVRESTVGRS